MNDGMSMARFSAHPNEDTRAEWTKHSGDPWERVVTPDLLTQEQRFYAGQTRACLSAR